MRPLGTVVRLQVQESSLKVGPTQGRSYNPSPIRAVPAITLSARGVTGLDETGAAVPDVHHRDHPSGKNRGENDVCILFTDHYRAMRERFGDHLTDGIAGESILVETNESVRPEDVNEGITIRTVGGGDALLEQIRVAEPCVEFTRFTIHYPPDARSDRAVTDALDFLRAGRRGFYAHYSGEPVKVALGDTVFLGARE
jgi:MOSC domain-containing protein YiiM